MRVRLVALAGCLLLVGCTGEAIPESVAATPQATEAASPQATPEPTSRARTASPSPSATAATEAALTSQALGGAIEAPAIRAHLEELQRIADENGGNRADGTPGFEASVEYVVRRLMEAGLAPEQQAFSYDGQTSINVIAELPGDPGSEVLMIGAHLDSVPAGPGINDDGSGVATALTVAERLAEFEPPEWTVRFAFWGAEEPGLKGSIAYLNALAPEERERVAAYLNLEMLGSRNFIRFVHADAGAPPGSDAITSLFALHFEGAGLAWEPIDLSGKTDHAVFTNAGIPNGGLFGGGREPKTDDQAARFGGTAGLPADPCSDVACDTIENINHVPLGEMADALADVIVILAGE
jgi:aminopeptidase S